MATVTVTNFSEFYAAAAVSGDTVVCPVAAVWDMNEIDPLNEIQLITINSNIVGNHTTIKHYRGQVKMGNGCKMEYLHFESALYDGETSPRNSFLYCDNNSGYGEVKLCKISTAVHSGGGVQRRFMINIMLTQCAVTTTFDGQALFASWPGTERASRYNRIKIIAPNATNDNGNWWGLADSEIYFDAPNMVKVNNTNTRCTINGDLQAAADTAGTSSNIDFSVINASGAPNMPSNARNIKPVTDEQMRSASALAAIGFVIGGDA